MDKLETEIGELLRKKGMILGAVESATGGLISHRITNIAGSSDYYNGSLTTYSNAMKVKLAGVRQETLDRHGAVSAPTAQEMAAGAMKTLEADICIADTGIAGPGGATDDKPVGLFFLGLAHGNTVKSYRHVFTGDRKTNKQQAAEAALTMLRDYLLSLG